MRRHQLFTDLQPGTRDMRRLALDPHRLVPTGAGQLRLRTRKESGYFNYAMSPELTQHKCGKSR